MRAAYRAQSEYRAVANFLYPLNRDLGRRFTQVISRTHDAAVCAGVRDEQHVTLAAFRQQSVGAEFVARFAYRADNIDNMLRGFVDFAEVRNFMISAVQRGAYQLIHARADPNVTHTALALCLCDISQQHTRFGDEIPAGLEP